MATSRWYVRNFCQVIDPPGEVPMGPAGTGRLDALVKGDLKLAQRALAKAERTDDANVRYVETDRAARLAAAVVTSLRMRPATCRPNPRLKGRLHFSQLSRLPRIAPELADWVWLLASDFERASNIRLLGAQAEQQQADRFLMEVHQFVDVVADQLTHALEVAYLEELFGADSAGG